MTDQPEIPTSVTPPPPPAAPTGAYAPPPAPVAAAAGATPKKPVYKQVWFWLVILFVALPILFTILGAIGLVAFSTSTHSVSEGVVQAPSGPAQETPSESAPEPEPEPEPEPVGYDAGMYKVGADLPAGEYALLEDSGMAYFQIAKESTGELDSIIANDNFANRSIITVKDGQYLTVSGARIIPLAEAIPPVAEGGLLPEGMYKVGTDLNAGEYKVISDGGMAYMEVSKNSSHTMDAIVSNDNFEGERYIRVTAGQYLKVGGASIKVK